MKCVEMEGRGGGVEIEKVDECWKNPLSGKIGFYGR
jgi:hypothetical protein